MPELNIVDMYKKGYSIQYIIDSYYRAKTKFDDPIIKKGDLFIIKKKSITKDECKKQVYKEIFEYLN